MTPAERVVPGQPPPWGPAGVCRADDLLASPRTRAGRAGGSVPGRGRHRHRVRPRPGLLTRGSARATPLPAAAPLFLRSSLSRQRHRVHEEGWEFSGGCRWSEETGWERRGERAERCPQVRARCAPGAAVRALTSERLLCTVRASPVPGAARYEGPARTPAGPDPGAPPPLRSRRAARAGCGERASGRRARRGSAGAAPSPEGLRPGSRGREDRTARSGRGTRRGARPTARDAAPWPGRGRGGPCCDPHFGPLSRREGDARDDAHVRTESASVRRHLVTWGAAHLSPRPGQFRGTPGGPTCCRRLLLPAESPGSNSEWRGRPRRAPRGRRGRKRSGAGRQGRVTATASEMRLEGRGELKRRSKAQCHREKGWCVK